LEHEEVLGGEAEGLMQEKIDAADHPSGTGQQNDGERELGDDQGTAGEAQAASGGSSADALKIVHEARLKGSPGGQESEEQSNGGRNDDHEYQDCRAQGRVREARQM
jgi:hypothetical protein